MIVRWQAISLRMYEKKTHWQLLLAKAKQKNQGDSESKSSEKNPQITNPHWENADGQTITKALVGDEVTLCADTQNIADGTSATIKIVEKDADGNDDDVATLSAKVQNNKIECTWKVVYTADDDDADSEKEQEEKGYTLPEYAFTVECGGEKSTESGQLDVRGWVSLEFDEKDSKILRAFSLCLYSENYKSKYVAISNRIVKFADLPLLLDGKKWTIGVE